MIDRLKRIIEKYFDQISEDIVGIAYYVWDKRGESSPKKAFQTISCMESDLADKSSAEISLSSFAQIVKSLVVAVAFH